MESNKQKTINDRLRFVFEVFIVFMFIFLFLLIPRVLLPYLVSEKSIYYGPLFYSLRAAAVLIVIPVFFIFAKRVLEPQEENNRIKEESNPSTNDLNSNSTSTSKTNFKDQLKYGVLFLFIILIPLDFLTYLLFPAMLEYSGVMLTSHATDSYLLQSYLIFLISVIIIQISVSIYEESVTRGFLTKRGSDHFHKMSAVLISSLYFGIMHFAYYLNPMSRNYPIWWPLFWSLQTFIVAIMLSILVLKKKSLFPAILAHAANNIISAHAVWNYLQGNDFIVVALYLYLPLLIFSGILFIWQFSSIKQYFLSGCREFRTYFKKDLKTKESKGDVYFRVFFDLVIGLLILAIGLFIFGI